MQSCGEFSSICVRELGRRSAVAWFIGQSLLFIVLAFVLGLLVGWLIWGRRGVVQISLGGGSSAATTSAAPTVPLPVPAPALESEPDLESKTEPLFIGASGASSSTVDLGSCSTVDARPSTLESSTVDDFDLGGGREAALAGGSAVGEPASRADAREADADESDVVGESSEFGSASVADFGLIESEPVADLEPAPGDFESARASALDAEE